MLCEHTDIYDWIASFSFQILIFTFQEEWVRLHWVAHSEPVAFMMFSPDGRLLLTSDTAGCQFRLFLLLPHSNTSTLAAVQHLYVLSRGTTPAKVRERRERGVGLLIVT